MENRFDVVPGGIEHERGGARWMVLPMVTASAVIRAADSQRHRLECLHGFRVASHKGDVRVAGDRFPGGDP